MPHATPSAPLQAVLFDFGNVIAEVDHARIAAALAPVCGLAPEELAARVQASGLLPAYECGRIDSAAYLAGISGLCGHAFEESLFLRAFLDIFTPIEDTSRLIGELKGRVRLGLLSNTNPWHFEHYIRTFPVFPLFDTVTVSHEVGAMKPDPRIYQDALAKLGLPPEACVFIDDIPAFVEGARQVGLHGIRYEGSGALRASLRQLGLAV